MKKLLAIFSWAVLLLVPVVAVVGWTQRQDIEDWYRLRDYQPPAEVAKLATDTTMTDDGRKLFYVYRPQLEGRETFSANCVHGEQTIVLGCYVSQTGIYLFDVDDPRLEGVEQVTAVHEMLHVAYERLSAAERERVDGLTKQAFAAMTDSRIKKTIENYRDRDPSVVPNELHSILATEVRDLPDELEQYYQQYFANRQQIVAFSEGYESILTARRTRASTLEAQITGLKNDIDQRERALADLQAGLARDRSGVATPEQADAYNARVRSYNQQIGAFNALIESYNQLIEEYKQNALEAEELFEAIDSRPVLE
jgi:hypothetical protein